MSGKAQRQGLHPWNRSFEWRETRRPLRRLSPQQAGAFDEQGFLLIENAFDPETVAKIVREIDPLEAEFTAQLRKRPDGRLFIAAADTITFCVHLVLRSERLHRFCTGPVFQDLTHDLIGPDVRLYWDQAVYKKPEKPRPFPWHQDNGYTYLEPQQYLTCWVALTDTDERNGCPWVVPGVHRQGTLEHWMTEDGWQCLADPPDAMALPVPAGGIAIFSSLTPHATGLNESEAVRKSYIVQFAPDGAHTLRTDPAGDGVVQDSQAHPRRQPLLLRDGQPLHDGKTVD